MSTSRPEVVVITGASAGVGRAVVRRFAAAGAHIALIARGRDGLEAARAEVEAAGGRALVVPADVSNWAQIDDAAARTERELGPIDIWINNAMVSVFSPVFDMQADEYRRVTEVTYLGVVHGTLAALRRMKPRNAGAIVQVGSALAYRGIPLQSAYCAAKHAVQGFMDSLRSELLHDRSAIRVTSVHLPAMNTPQFDWAKSRLPNRPQPVPPIYQPEVAADAIYWAAHHERREVWIGAPTVMAILGDRVAPAAGDRVLAATAFESQQAPEPDDPNRPHNLWEPLPGDRGAHGRFDERARSWSAQAWATTHRSLTVGGILAAGAMIAMAALALNGERDADEAEMEGSAGPGPEERERLRRLIEEKV